MRITSSFLRTTATFALVALLLPLSPSTGAFAAFSDISASAEYRTSINALQAKGVLEGYSDGTFKPNATVNRAELLKIVLESQGGDSFNGQFCFPDVKDQWFARYVCRAKKLGIINGYPDGTFGPEKAVNFVEIAKILSLAYGQTTQQHSNDWYEPYALALESSNAIPPTVNALDKAMTRGEMAEMMWRLSEGKTDLESKSYLNVKYPELSIDLHSDTPVQATRCADLAPFVSQNQNVYYDKSMSEQGFGGVMPPMAMMDGSSGTRNKSTANAVSKDDYSATNVQVEGIDEGDIVKTDGEYLYILSRNNGTVRIVDARSPTNPTLISTIAVENFFGSELYVDGSVLVVIGTLSEGNVGYPGYPMPLGTESRSMIYPPQWSVQKSTVLLFDIASRKTPKELRRVSTEGQNIATRLKDGVLVQIQSSWPRFYPMMNERPTASASDFLPLYDDSSTNIRNKPVADCDDVAILPRVPNPQYLVTSLIPLNAKGQIHRSVILGNAETVYVSDASIYAAAVDWQYNWKTVGMPAVERTHLYRFSYSPTSVKFEAHGIVNGHLLNQFSMDEHEGMLRTATTIGEQWNEAGAPSVSRNNVYVLNADLEVVGSVADIAPGETIYSVRFMGKRAYMVTFKKIDPFFVIDLSNPRSPKILGALKIPGYSDYLHPYDENHIIGFGKDAVDDGKSDFAWYQGMKIALFDVTDTKNPKQLFTTSIGDRGTQSPLLSDHKALLFDKERGLLAFPVQVLELNAEQKAKPDDGSAYGSPVFQGAYVYDLSLSKGFTLRGKISHYSEEDFLKSGSQWYGYGKDIERIVRIGDALFSISENVVKANALSTLREQGSVTIGTQMDPPIMY